MKKTTKGALAAAAAGTLLLGGAGTYAYWTSTTTVTGTNLAAGHLRLTSPDCGAWQLDSLEDAPVTYASGDPLVPGDVLTKHCSYVIQASGNHLRATVSADDAAVPASFTGAISVDATALSIGGTPTSEITEDNDGDTLDVDLTVTFNSNVTDHQDVTGALGAVTVTASQIHH